jgi:integrase
MRGRALGPGRLERRDSTWVLTYTDEHGQRRRVSLSRDRRTAERVRADVIRKRDMAVSGLGSEAGQEMLLADLTKQYLEDLRPRACALHHKNVSARLGRIVAALEGLRVADLKPMHLVRLRAMAQSAGAANRTANLIASTLQAVLRWGVENEIVGRNPVAHVKPLPYTRADFRYKRRALSERELAAFLRAVEDDDEECEVLMQGMQRVPQLPLFLTLVTTGIRWNEARLLTWNDLDLKRRVLVVRAEHAKSKRERSIPLSEDLAGRLMQLKMLHETVHARLPSSADRVFLSPEGCPWLLPTTNIVRVLRRLLERAGIRRVDTDGRRVDLHALRTTAASRLARSNVPLVKTQKILGHADPRTTSQVYVALEVEDLRDAIEALPPIARTDHAPGASRSG